MESGKFSLWAFTGHGSDQDSTYPNNSAMIQNNNEKFNPDYRAGKVRNLGLGTPLVFINACQIEKSGVSLTGIGGWTPKFLDEIILWHWDHPTAYFWLANKSDLC